MPDTQPDSRPINHRSRATREYNEDERDKKEFGLVPVKSGSQQNIPPAPTRGQHKTSQAVSKPWLTNTP